MSTATPPAVRGSSGETPTWTPRSDISDGVRLLSALFLGAEEIHCEDAADANDDGYVNVADPITVFGQLFSGRQAIKPPGHLACGVDPSLDEIECLDTGSCRSSL